MISRSPLLQLRQHTPVFWTTGRFSSALQDLSMDRPSVEAEISRIESELSLIESSLKSTQSNSEGAPLSRQGSSSSLDALVILDSRLRETQTHLASLNVSDDGDLASRISALVPRINDAQQAIGHSIPLDMLEVQRAATPRPFEGADLSRPSSAVDLQQEFSELDPTLPSSQSSAESFHSAHASYSASEEPDKKRMKEDPEEDLTLYERTSLLFESKSASTLDEPSHPTTTLYSWGRSDCGALFHADDQPHSPSEPVGFSSKDTHVVDFSASLYHAAIVTRSGGLRTCGQNEEGMVSPDSTETVFKPSLVEPMLSHRIAKVACGLYHTAVLTDKGTVMTFGGNEFGQLGHSEGSISRVAPKVVTGLENQEISQIVCGELFTLALSSKLQVYSWGSPDSTGHSPDVDSTSRATRIREFIGMPIKRLAAGAAHAMAITMAGHVYSWGRNTHGQTGVHEVNEEGQPSEPQRLVQTPLKVGKFVDPVAGDEFTDAHTGQVHIGDAACGESHTILLDTEGQLWGCGRNNKGQLGMGDREGCRVPTHMQVGGDDTTFIQIACGSNHTLLLSARRDVFAAGEQSSGECLGTSGGPEDLHSFQMLHELSPEVLKEPVVLLEAGGSQSMALSAFDANSSASSLASFQHLEGSALDRRFSHVSFVDLAGNSTSHQGPSMFSALSSPQQASLSHPSPHRSRVEAALDALGADSAKFKDDQVIEAIAAVRRMFDSASVLSGVAQLRPHHLRRQESRDHNKRLRGHDRDRVNWTVGLDLIGLESLYKRILDLSPDTQRDGDDTGELQSHVANISSLNKHLSQGLLNVVQDLFGKFSVERDAFASVSHTVGCESGAVRAVLAVWQCPLFTLKSPVIHQALLTFVRGVDSTFFKSKTHRKKLLQALVADAASYPELYFSRFVQPLVQLVDTIFDAKKSKQSDSFHSAVRLLNLLFTVNEWHAARLHEPIIREDSFVSSAVSELPVLELLNSTPSMQQFGKGPLFADFELFKSPTTRSQSQFCRFPFLLRADTKRELLRVEARIQQEVAGAQALQQNMFMLLLNPAMAAMRYLILQISRQNLVQQTMAMLSQIPDNDLKKELKVAFVGEEGVDEGGVRKEFFQLLIEKLFAPQYGMFTAQENGDLWFNIGCVWADEEYMLVGMLIGLALYNGVLLDLHFPTVVFKKLLPKQRFNLRDVSDLDPELAKGLRQLLDYEPAEDVEGIFCRTFEVTWTSFGEEQRTALKPGGADIAVTGENRKEFVELYVRWLLEDSVAQQFAAFKKGFDRVMGSATMDLLRPEDLEAIVVGTPHLDFQALQEVTSYEGGYTETTPVIQWFWEIVKEMETESQKNLLMFSTGSIKAPIGGLGKLPFKVQRMGPDSDQLPTSHTCFNTLLIPEYSSKEKLQRLLNLAIEECEGFGLK